MFKGQHHESRKSLSLLLTREHAYCKKSQLLRGTFCFTQVQGPNALTTLLHLADELGLGRSKLKPAHPVNYFPGYLGKNDNNCPPIKIYLPASQSIGEIGANWHPTCFCSRGCYQPMAMMFSCCTYTKQNTKRTIPASRLWPKKMENFTFEWLQLLVQTCYQQIFDW